MCGIVAYLGRKEAAEVLINGLRRLEYRGYDSAGLATLGNGGVELRRSVGRVSQLSAQLERESVHGSLGIAHTRWATHGRPTIANAHPHLDQSGRIALVHNGVIENHAALREFLAGQGVTFQSETDSESLAQLIGFLYRQSGDFLESVRNALREVRGTFGLAILCADFPRMLVAARRGSPLVVGLGDEEYVVASDASAIVAHTTQAVFLDDNEIACLTPEDWQTSRIDATRVDKTVTELEASLEQIELDGYAHYMLKEIREQPERLRTCLKGRVHAERGELKLGGLDDVDVRREVTAANRVLLFGCGTAWHAALIGRFLFEEVARIPTSVEYSSELRYRNPIVESGTLAIAVSQSGETADTLAALREVRLRGATVLGVSNVVGSTIARETDAGVYLRVGPEIGVASTKAFTAQVVVLAMIAADLGRRRHLSPERFTEFLRELDAIPGKMEVALGLETQVRQLAGRLAEYGNWMYLGRGVNFPTALEGALKLKEVSYLHAEGLPAAEMKHGPIAMIDASTPVVVLAPRDHTYDKVLANIEEVRSRDGRIIVVATAKDSELERLAEEVLYVPDTLPLLTPLLTMIPLQLLAYHIAVIKGRDVDKPRNLAKSVTVE